MWEKNQIHKKNNEVMAKVNKIENKAAVEEKKVYKKEYKIQRIDGLPKKQVTPPKEVYERIKKDNILIGKAREVDTALEYFKEKFIKPVDKAIITGVYGSQRILNGKPRRPHYGLDFAADEGTPIKAMMSGTVTLAERDLYFTGGTIIFDHGHGISTLYMHMKDLYIKIGQEVKKGDVISRGEIIANVGSSEVSSPMLRFQLRKNGSPVKTSGIKF